MLRGFFNSAQSRAIVFGSQQRFQSHAAKLVTRPHGDMIPKGLRDKFIHFSHSYCVENNTTPEKEYLRGRKLILEGYFEKGFQCIKQSLKIPFNQESKFLLNRIMHLNYQLGLGMMPIEFGRILQWSAGNNHLDFFYVIKSLADLFYVLSQTLNTIEIEVSRERNTEILWRVCAELEKIPDLAMVLERLEKEKLNSKENRDFCIERLNNIIDLNKILSRCSCKLFIKLFEFLKQNAAHLSEIAKRIPPHPFEEIAVLTTILQEIKQEKLQKNKTEKANDPFVENVIQTVRINVSR